MSWNSVTNMSQLSSLHDFSGHPQAYEAIRKMSISQKFSFKSLFILLFFQHPHLHPKPNNSLFKALNNCLNSETYNTALERTPVPPTKLPSWLRANCG